MELLLINPPQIFSKYQVATGIVPPLGLAYLASYAIKEGIDVEIIDALGESPDTITPFTDDIYLRGMTHDQIIDRISYKTKLIGISNLFSFAFPDVKILIEEIKSTFPNIPVVLGGPHPTHLCDYTLKNTKTDYIIIGEGEVPLIHLWNFITGDLLIDDVPSLAYLNDDGEVIRTVAFPRIKNINSDNLPFPARHLLPMENYIGEQEAHGAVNDRWTTILSSRGCPYGCTFCDSRRTKFISRTATDVVDEIEHCNNKYGIVEFHFEDDNMTLQRDRIIEICEEIIKRGLDIRWQTPNGIRASVTDEVMLLKMKESGCTHITLAPESGSKRVMEEIVQKGKDFSHDQLLEIGRSAHKIGMKSAAYFILGLPGEKIDDIKQTIAYANQLARAGVDEVSFGLFIPLPGTPLWDHVVDNYGQPDFLDLLVIGDLNRAVSWTEYVTSDELNNFRRRAYLLFQLNRMIFHPIKFWNTLLNVFRGFAETKTENKIRTFIKRKSNKSNKYTSYDTGRTILVLLKNNPVYAYTESTYKSVKTFFNK